MCKNVLFSFHAHRLYIRNRKHVFRVFIYNTQKFYDTLGLRSRRFVVLILF